MKKFFLASWFSLWLLFSLCNISNAWENKLTRPAITEQAASPDLAIVDDYLKTQLDLDDGLLTQLHWNFPKDIERRTRGGQADPYTKNRTVLEWIKLGSTIDAC